MTVRVYDTILGYSPLPLLVILVLLGVAWWPLAVLAMLGKIGPVWFFGEWIVAILWAGVCLLAGMIRKVRYAKITEETTETLHPLP